MVEMVELILNPQMLITASADDKFSVFFFSEKRDLTFHMKGICR